MSNIWSNVGQASAPAVSTEWLYRSGAEIRGPVPTEIIVDKLKKGELTVKSMVAREGGEFHPVGEIAAFATHLEDVKRALSRRTASKARRVIMLGILVVGAIAAGAGWWFKQQAAVRAAAEAELAAKKKAESEKALAEAQAVLQSTKTELVALVSLGDISEVKVGSSPAKPKAGTSKPGPAGEPPMVQSCARSQQEIFGTLGKHLAKINVCVQNEKASGQGNLLPSSLTLEFVVVPAGTVVDFEIDDRHYRTGPMKNCMVKAFRMIKFDQAGGSNCPVSIPIKIGN